VINPGQRRPDKDKGAPRPCLLRRCLGFFLSDERKKCYFAGRHTGSSLNRQKAIQEIFFFRPEGCAGVKRYRYTGKERDEETGLYYHGARYYIPWLARWSAVDPLLGEMPEWSSYNYGYCNPITWTDPTGMAPGNGDTPQVEPVKPIYGGELEEVVVTAKAPETVSGSAPGSDLQQSQIILSPQQGNVTADALSVFMYRPLPEQLFESEEARMMQLAQEQLVQNTDVLTADVYGVGHMGPQASVQRSVGLINREYSNAVGDNIRGGFFGALGYTIAGDRGSFVGAGVDNAAAAGAAIKGGIPQKPVTVPQPPPNTGIGLANRGEVQSLGAGRTAVKQWLQNVGNLERGQLIKDIGSVGFKKVFEGKGMMHFERGGMKIRLDPPQPGTPFSHMHLNYGGNKNAYDIFLNRVNYKSPAAHIPIR
jgi:RHS repeat-associated protein